MTPPSLPLSRQRNSRAQAALLFTALTAGIATGLAIYSSAAVFIDLVQTATVVLFLPLLLSLVLAFLLDPPVTLLERRFGRTGAIFVVYLLVAIGILLFFSWLIPHWQTAWTSLQADLPRYTARLTAFLRELLDKVQAELPFVDTHDLLARVRVLSEDLVRGVIISTPKSALRLGGLLLMVPLFTFFFLRDGGRILRSCISLAPNRTFEMVHDLTNLITAQLAHFIRGRIIEATIVGLVVYVGLSFTDIRYTGFLAVFAGVTNLVPYIGPLIGMVPGVLIALVDLGLGGEFWWIIITYFLIAQVIVDNFILIPILISRYSNLHPLWVIIAIIIGGKLYGVLGMIIGVPIASTVKIVLSEIRQYRRSFSLIDGNIDLDS